MWGKQTQTSPLFQFAGSQGDDTILTSADKQGCLFLFWCFLEVLSVPCVSLPSHLCHLCKLLPIPLPCSTFTFSFTYSNQFCTFNCALLPTSPPGYGDQVKKCTMLGLLPENHRSGPATKKNKTINKITCTPRCTPLAPLLPSPLFPHCHILNIFLLSNFSGNFQFQLHL